MSNDLDVKGLEAARSRYREVHGDNMPEGDRLIFEELLAAYLQASAPADVSGLTQGQKGEDFLDIAVAAMNSASTAGQALRDIMEVAHGRDRLDGFPRDKQERQRRLAKIYEIAHDTHQAVFATGKATHGGATALTTLSATVARMTEERDEGNKLTNKYAWERDKAREERNHAERRSELFWKAKVTALTEALERSGTALDDWLNIYASDLCAPERVAEAQERIAQFGTIGYIADVQQQNRTALSHRGTE